MSEDRSSNQSPGHRSWLERLAMAFSGDPRNRSELLEQLREAETNDIVDAEALSIIEGALSVADMQVREIMIPRSQVVCIKSCQQPREFLPSIIESAHSRFPVIGDTMDDVIGILLAKDLLTLLLNDGPSEFDIREILRPATFVPESKRLNVLLKEFRATRNHMAVVIDEYGGVAGLVTIEDVLEQIVGDIEDEHDVDDEHFIKQVGENDFIVKALTPIEDFNEQFGSEFSDREFDTIGGIVMQGFGHLPKRNEQLSLQGFNFRILNADNRRIRLLRVSTN
ncbi:HlyC/CorC family transporter [Aestuariirhabdus litorea]|uniref:Magnesium and cobalt efflux protein CorC n=1 Tax=Aestuariirhabdus litorea TaxID=2528527 RepID=A0A3P3VPL5_9GAMM|nr:transporter associated domain-containing protein [Aestuariirhabdus litorea]RRJ83579.1 CBS domain-containing protein [Aestuariirhabdus litorea]RWW96800.1 CBS domain-containing protein [Endozoicomonadaceae bacterium GTF-13]